MLEHCEVVDLAIHRAGGTIGRMIKRLARSTVLLLILSVVYSGPVAACVCADEPMPEMPCCPDDPQRADHSDSMHTGFAFDPACEPAPADVLPAGTQDIPAPAAISSGAPPPWLTHGPPAVQIPAFPEPFDSPPIYLVTLRLRN